MPSFSFQVRRIISGPLLTMTRLRPDPDGRPQAGRRSSRPWKTQSRARDRGAGAGSGSRRPPRTAERCSAAGLGGPPVAAHVVGDHAELSLQSRDLRLPVFRARSQSVNQQHRLARPPLLVIDVDSSSDIIGIGRSSSPANLPLAEQIALQHAASMRHLRFRAPAISIAASHPPVSRRQNSRSPGSNPTRRAIARPGDLRDPHVARTVVALEERDVLRQELQRRRLLDQAAVQLHSAHTDRLGARALGPLRIDGPRARSALRQRASATWNGTSSVTAACSICPRSSADSRARTPRTPRLERVPQILERALQRRSARVEHGLLLLACRHPSRTAQHAGGGRAPASRRHPSPRTPVTCRRAPCPRRSPPSQRRPTDTIGPSSGALMIS